MQLIQSRIVTDDVEGLAAFYARLVGTPVALNEYYVEVPAGAMSVRAVVVHMIEEYAQHNGHADLLRERIDGVTDK